MDKYTGSAASQQQFHNFVPTIDEVVAPPQAPIHPEIEEESQSLLQTQAGLIVIVASNFLITLVSMTIMLIAGNQVSEVLQRGMNYFSITTPIYAIIITGTLTKVLNRWARESTERQRIKSYERVMLSAIQWRQMIEVNRSTELHEQSSSQHLARRLAAVESEMITQRVNADPPQTPSRFVTPYDNRSQAAHSETTPQVDTTANEALSWLNGIYDEYGRADASKIGSDGRLKVRMLGSARGPGSREAGLWLIQKGIIRKVPGGFALDVMRFRTRESLRNLL